MGMVKHYLQQRLLLTFSGQTPHIHFDIAGPATINRATFKGPKGPTGYMIPTVIEWMKQQYK